MPALTIGRPISPPALPQRARKVSMSISRITAARVRGRVPTAQSIRPHSGVRTDFYVQRHLAVTRPDPLPDLTRAILTKRLTFRGFIVSDLFGRYGDFMRDVSTWVGERRIKYREDVVEGLKNAPRALIGLLRGENFGKLLVRVATGEGIEYWHSCEFRSVHKC